MATTRYWNVRHDVYDYCASTPLKKTRSFNEMRQLFKWSYWAVLATMFLLLLFAAFIFLRFPNRAYYALIPLGFALLLPILLEIWGEKMYHSAARQKELDRRANELDEYLVSMKTILASHGITTSKQIDCLRRECEERLNQHQTGSLSASSKSSDLLIGIPLGALITSIVSNDQSLNAVIPSIILLIIACLFIIGISRVIKKISFYSEGCFKDRILLEMLNELDYYTQ